MRRVLSVSLGAILLFSAFAAIRERSAHRMFAAFKTAWAAEAASPGAGNLKSAGPAVFAGCALGPAATFCDQAPGTSSSPAVFSVLNTAAVTNVSVSLAAIPGLSANFAAGDFAIAGGTCSGNLAANQGCQISVAFSPTAAGLRQAAIGVTDAQGDSLAINIEGAGNNLAFAPPALLACGTASLRDNAFPFCQTAVGGGSGGTETLTLTAGPNGAAGITIATAAIPGLESEFASGDFALSNNTCGALAAGQSCTIGVTFTPSAKGTRAAALKATDSAGDSAALLLSGEAAGGIGFVSSGAVQTCSAAQTFQFCNLPSGGISATSVYSLTNTSGAQITGLSVPKNSVIPPGATAADFTVQNSSCAATLAAGASCNVSITFTPTKSGLRQGVIAVNDAQGDVADLNLAGYGDDYSIATQLPTEVSVIAGGTATFNATLTPDNVLGMNGEQVTFVCPTNLPDNTSCVVTPCPAAITPGTPVSVKVSVVTSSATVIAPVPTSGCSSYGPSISALMRPPMPGQRTPPAAGAAVSRASPLFPALWIVSAIAALGFLIVGFALPDLRSRRRLPLVLACAGMAAAILTGCRHHSAAATTATQSAVTNLTILGNALDAGGNSLNASRSFSVTLDVVAK
ncbi:MAG: choice-of-anchor D domain-containing protein [Acidobacteriota bacterium]|nr:choice-of-anchor D domain-containing protein [Acidobacteriota bacterium]